MIFRSVHVVLQYVDKERFEYRVNGLDIPQEEISRIITTFTQLAYNRDKADVVSVLFEGSVSSPMTYHSVTCLLNIMGLSNAIKVDTSCICDIQSEDISKNWHDEVENSISEFKSNSEVANYATVLLTNWIANLLDGRIKQIPITI